MQQPRRSPLCAFATHLGFDTLLREMSSGINVGADSRWIWAIRMLVLGFAALATAHLIRGIIHRNVIGPLFWASATGVALSLLACGAILELLSTDKHMKLGLVLAASWGRQSFCLPFRIFGPSFMEYGSILLWVALSALLETDCCA